MAGLKDLAGLFKTGYVPTGGGSGGSSNSGSFSADASRRDAKARYDQNVQIAAANRAQDQARADAKFERTFGLQQSSAAGAAGARAIQNQAVQQRMKLAKSQEARNVENQAYNSAKHFASMELAGENLLKAQTDAARVKSDTMREDAFAAAAGIAGGVPTQRTIMEDKVVNFNPDQLNSMNMVASNAAVSPYMASPDIISGGENSIFASPFPITNLPLKPTGTAPNDSVDSRGTSAKNISRTMGEITQNRIGRTYTGDSNEYESYSADAFKKKQEDYEKLKKISDKASKDYNDTIEKAKDTARKKLPRSYIDQREITSTVPSVEYNENRFKAIRKELDKNKDLDEQTKNIIIGRYRQSAASEVQSSAQISRLKEEAINNKAREIAKDKFAMQTREDSNIATNTQRNKIELKKVAVTNKVLDNLLNMNDEKYKNGDKTEKQYEDYIILQANKYL